MLLLCDGASVNGLALGGGFAFVILCHDGAGDLDGLVAYPQPGYFFVHQAALWKHVFPID